MLSNATKRGPTRPGSRDRRVVPGRGEHGGAPGRPGVGALRLQGHLQPGRVRRKEAGRGGKGREGAVLHWAVSF